LQIAIKLWYYKMLCPSLGGYRSLSECYACQGHASFVQQIFRNTRRTDGEEWNGNGVDPGTSFSFRVRSY